MERPPLPSNAEATPLEQRLQALEVRLNRLKPRQVDGNKDQSNEARTDSDGQNRTRAANSGRSNPSSPGTLGERLLSAEREIEQEVFGEKAKAFHDTLSGESDKWGTGTLTSDQLRFWEAEFKENAGNGELELWTCLALSNGLNGFWTRDTPAIMLRAVIAFLMQICIPCMMITYRVDDLRSEQPPTDWKFRVTGFIVYIYSLKNMYENAIDDCRTILLNIAVHYPLPWHYIWPAILGDLVNSLVSMGMALALLSNFLVQSHPADLVINAVSLNFLGNIDNEIVDEGMKERANVLFDQLVEGGPQHVHYEKLQHFVVKGAVYSLFLFRVLVTCLGGFVCACIFLCSKELEAADWLCENISGSFGFC